jgi:tetratricopeptide (TPR) repeat protein
MAKPMAVTLPLVLLLLDWWPLYRVADSMEHAAALQVPSQSPLFLVLEKLPLMALSMACSLAAYASQSENGAVAHLNVGRTAVHVVWAYVAYMGKLVWPARQSIFYSWSLVPSAGWKPLLDAGILLVLTVTCWAFRRERYALMAWLFYIVTMLPVSGIIQVGPQSLYDHYLYLPEVGIFILAVWAVERIARSAKVPAPVALLTGLVVCSAYAYTNHLELPNWCSSYRIFSRAEALSPTPEVLIEHNLAGGLDELNRRDEAALHYRRAIALRPEMALGHYSLAGDLLDLGRLQEAIAEFRAALTSANTTRFDRSHCLHDLAVALGKAGDWAEADRWFTAALAINPQNPKTLLSRGNARLNLEQYRTAADDFEHTLALQPSPEALYLLGKALAGENKLAEAAAAQAAALRMAPDFSDAQAELTRLNSAIATIRKSGNPSAK